MSEFWDSMIAEQLAAGEVRDRRGSDAVAGAGNSGRRPALPYRL